jgi:hypothetical protein
MKYFSYWKGNKTMTVVSEAKIAGLAQGSLGVLALVVLAQIWPGWQLDSAADKEKAAAYNAGYTLAQGPVCASLFMAQPDAAVKLAELKAANGSYAQMKFIPEALRTLPGAASVSDALGRECLKFIVAPPQSAQM